MPLIDKKELRLGKNRVADALATGLMMRFLGIRRLNRLYESLSGYRGREFTRQFLSQRAITYSVRPSRGAPIPEKGGLVVVANHPFGALDGMLLLDLLSGIRGDVKFMGNELLSRIKPMEDFFIEIDPFRPTGYKHLNGLRKCREHVCSGGVLVVFPADEVSTYQQGFTRLEDKPWNESTLKFIRNCRVPVCPVYIEGTNSRLFHLLGKAGPVFRASLLAREILNKKNIHYRLYTGSPLLPFRFDSLSPAEFGEFLRTNVYLLKNIGAPGIPGPDREPPMHEPFVPIGGLTDAAALAMDTLTETLRLAEYNGLAVAALPASGVPAEVVSRLPIPLPLTDVLVWVWDPTGKTLPAWTRLRPGDRIDPLEFGFSDGFRPEEPLRPVLHQTLEVSEFYADGTSRSLKTLYLLLWQGLIRYFGDHGAYRYLVGVVRTPDRLKPVSRALLTEYILKNHYHFELAANLTADPPAPHTAGEAAPSVAGVRSLNGLDKLVSDMEEGMRSMPSNLRKYLALKADVIGMRSADRPDGPAIDYLMIYDRANLPEAFRKR